MAHKYKVGQRCILLPPSKPRFRKFIGVRCTITALVRQRKGLYYEVSTTPPLRVPAKSVGPVRGGTYCRKAV